MQATGTDLTHMPFLAEILISTIAHLADVSCSMRPNTACALPHFSRVDTRMIGIICRGVVSHRCRTF